MPTVLQYKNGKFSVDAIAVATVHPHFEFKGTAGVKVYTDLLVTDLVYYSNDWDLFDFKWDPDFRIGMIFPVHYVFGGELSLSKAQIAFLVPDISFIGLLKKMLPF